MEGNQQAYALIIGLNPKNEIGTAAIPSAVGK
jgi:hypothetical protein